MMFRSVAIEREEKLKSLLINQVHAEVEMTRFIVNRVMISEISRKKWDDALAFALLQNYGSRNLDKYYVTHPLRLCRFLAHALDPKLVHFDEALIAALVHNVIEKKIFSFDELKQRYTTWIADAVLTLTPDRSALVTELGKKDYYDCISKKSVEVHAIKIFDKFDNLFSVCLCPDAEIREEYLLEAQTHLRPFIHNLFPWLLSYFDELIAENRRVGFYLPSYS
jgi:(p)ppGpp synthase/HD superfamily hydrolase